MDLNRFTNKAREAVLAAQQSAQDRGNPRVELEHLFAVLLENSEDLVPQILDRAGVSPADARAELNEALGKFPQVSGEGLRAEPTQELIDVLSQAEKEAKRLKDEYVSVEHLLLGLFEKAPRSRM